MNGRYLFLVPLVFVTGSWGCKPQVAEISSTNGSAKDLVLPESGQEMVGAKKALTNATSLRLQISGIREIDVPSQVCYAYADPDIANANSVVSEGLNCVHLDAGQNSIELSIKNIPTSAYIFVFHDKNSNGKLDYTVMNVLVEKREAIAEGYAFVEDSNTKSEDAKTRRILVLAPGENSGSVTLTYGGSAFEQFVLEKGWEYVFGKAKDAAVPFCSNFCE
jgi:uncharacterized protein (DUF2141 family)